MKNLIIFLLLVVWFLATVICCLFLVPMVVLYCADGDDEWFCFPRQCISKLS